MSQPSTPELHPALHDNRRAVFESLFSAAAFAIVSTMVHGIGQQIAWPVVAFARIAMTWLFAFSLLRATGAPIIILGTPVLWCRSLTGAVGLLCMFYALTHMHVTAAVTIIATNPIWVMAILAVVLNHHLTWIVALDVALAIAGVYVMNRPTFDADLLPMAAALCAALCAAVVKVSLSRLGHLPTVSVVTHHTTIASLTALAVSFAIVPSVIIVDHVSPLVWWLLLPLGLIGTLSQLAMTSAYGRGNTIMVTLVGLSSIAFAALFDVLVWDRTFDRYHALGALMIAAAVTLSVTRAAREQNADQATRASTTIAP